MTFLILNIIIKVNDFNIKLNNIILIETIINTTLTKINLTSLSI